MRRYQGMTLIGMLFTMAVVIIVGITVMRIIPVYLENYSVEKSIAVLKRIPSTELSDDPVVASGLLRDKLVNQLYVNGIELPADNIKITPNGVGNYKVSVKYQVKRHLLGNMSLLFEFDETQEVRFGNG
jgi:hypothetical protein